MHFRSENPKGNGADREAGMWKRKAAEKEKQ